MNASPIALKSLSEIMNSGTFGTRKKNMYYKDKTGENMIRSKCTVSYPGFAELPTIPLHAALEHSRGVGMVTIHYSSNELWALT